MIKISIQESLLRSMIRHLLIEEEGPPVQITPNSTWIQYKDKGNLVGKKFSATHNGEPNFVIIYDNANFGYMNLDDLNKMGIAGKHWIIKNRDWDIVANNYSDLLYKIKNDG